MAVRFQSRVSTALVLGGYNIQWSSAGSMWQHVELGWSGDRYQGQVCAILVPGWHQAVITSKIWQYIESEWSGNRYQGQVSAALVLGGVDLNGPHLFTVYPHGSTDVLPYATMGSGSLNAMAVFETEYRCVLLKSNRATFRFRYRIALSILIKRPTQHLPETRAESHPSAQ